MTRRNNDPARISAATVAFELQRAASSGMVKVAGFDRPLELLGAYIEQRDRELQLLQARVAELEAMFKPAARIQGGQPPVAPLGVPK